MKPKVQFSVGNRKWLSDRADTLREEEFLEYVRHDDSRIIQRLLKILKEREEKYNV